MESKTFVCRRCKDAPCVLTACAADGDLDSIAIPNACPFRCLHTPEWREEI